MNEIDIGGAPSWYRVEVENQMCTLQNKVKLVLVLQVLKTKYK